MDGRGCRVTRPARAVAIELDYSNFVGGGDGGQLFLMPPDSREWLPPGYLAFEVLDRVADAGLARRVADPQMQSVAVLKLGQ